MIEMKGLNELAKKLDSLAQRAGDLHGSHEVPLTELLSPGFLAKCSQFVSLDEMFAASGFEVKNTEDFKAIPDTEWDDFIRKNTSYESWSDMLSAASGEWVLVRLGV